MAEKLNEDFEKMLPSCTTKLGLISEAVKKQGIVKMCTLDMAALKKIKAVDKKAIEKIFFFLLAEEKKSPVSSKVLSV